MNTLFDTHVHFETRDDEHGISQTVQRALKAGVLNMLAVGGCAESNHAALSAASSYPENVKAAIGIDRSFAKKRKDQIEEEFSKIKETISRRKDIVSAIGETGLDFFYEPETAGNQIDLFKLHLDLAADTGLPLVIHSRNAEKETIECLRKYSGKLKGVLHCFTGSFEFAEELIKLGLFISFSGILTFKNADSLRETASRLPSGKLLLETDSPYLAPVPLRGSRNEPSFLPHILKTFAEAKRIGIDEAARITSANAALLFGFGPS